MKKTLLILSASLLLILGGCTSEKNATESNKKQSDELVVATSGTLFPSSYYNDKNELTGYDIEVTKEIGKRLNKKVTFKEFNVDGMLSAVQTNKADVAANDFSTNKKREEKFSLSEPIKYSFGSMVVRKEDNSGISSLDDVKGKKAAGEASTTYMKVAESLGATLVNYDNATNDQYMTDLVKGRTDVILNDYYLQKMAVAALPDMPVKILEDVYFNPSSSGLVINKDNTELKKDIDSAITDMKKDGTLAKIATSFYGEDISKKPSVTISKTIEVD
ncbi:transporter substrate-binding domain-containing protein [Vagococcus bubulae]|uniref:ABC transporter substrate-binding protein n=1 Tax=Vagococcus bubulae TaxID=1977868 RepID=A0A429ZIA7_9ENTE|nr:transporter substrate-binding domain-containing protein [Vagococcus bubulae]RST93436.1 ABC transporter substrate-binding protein [Vagococcus bubulae]